uniref:Pyrin domain-containing protein n=1 Tax=Sander lucioperca TaxID=283035 RepID=A0A8C9Z653_SANLU
MVIPRKVVLGILEDLGADDFEEFKWHLQGVLNDFPAIPKSKLENENRVKTVNTMFQTYGKDTTKVTKIVLENMYQNELAQKLSETMNE